MARWHAFQLYTSDDGIEMGADLNASDAWKRLSLVLADCQRTGSKLETVQIGQVEADNLDAALDEIRSERWVGTVGSCDCVGYPADEDSYTVDRLAAGEEDQP